MTESAPRYAETELKLAPGLYPFQSHFLDTGGARLHYVDEGRGPLLFMLHGAPTWNFIYRKLIAALAHRFRCVAMDLPGFGLSEPPAGFRYRPEDHVPFVTALLDHLDCDGGVLVAHDWGGPIGLAAALATPGRLTRYILGNTIAWPLNGDWHFEWFSALMGGPIGRWFSAPRINLLVNFMLLAAPRRQPLPPEVLHAYRAPFLRSGNTVGTCVFPASITGSRHFLRQLEMDVQRLDGRDFLFVWPDRDVAFRPVELARWRRMFPQAAVAPIARCGHLLWEEAADESVDAILAWPTPTAAVARHNRNARGRKETNAPGAEAVARPAQASVRSAQRR
jgi:haloalkane dehalogenase